MLSDMFTDDHNDQIEQALAVLDAKVAAAEANLAEAQLRLNEARAERRGADALAAILRSTPARGVLHSEVPDDNQEMASAGRGVNTGLTHVIESVVRSRPETSFSVDEMMAIPEVRELAPSRQQVRNGLYYLTRKHILERGARGRFRLVEDRSGRDAEAIPILRGRAEEETAVPF